MGADRRRAGTTLFPTLDQLKHAPSDAATQQRLGRISKIDSWGMGAGMGDCEIVEIYLLEQRWEMLDDRPDRRPGIKDSSSAKGGP